MQIPRTSRIHELEHKKQQEANLPKQRWNSSHSRGLIMQYICDHCGKQFTKAPSQRYGKHTFCSQKCRAIYYAKKQKGNKKKGRKTDAYQKIIRLAKMREEIEGTV